MLSVKGEQDVLVVLVPLLQPTFKLLLMGFQYLV